MNVTWEETQFAGLDELDQEGQERVSQLGTMPGEADEPDAPYAGTQDLPTFEELDLGPQSPRLA
jgi:hypothetical protein